jgi:hypothetical protein
MSTINPQHITTQPSNLNLSPVSNRKTFFLLSFIFLFLVAFSFGAYTLFKSNSVSQDNITNSPISQDKAQATMILIEYKDTVGLVNFVNELKQRQIPGLLHVSADFVEANCDTINQLLKHNMEIMASIDGVLWDMPYDQQKDLIADAVTRIESCTNQPVKIISSKYMASDITTLQVAQELNIPYITARGTTDAKATVYQIEGYTTKILSVSNIPDVRFKYGSLCDYSFFERSGQPQDMLDQLTWAIQPLTDKEKAILGPHHRVTPVTHTNIGGYLKPWMEMWINFWDTTTGQIDWVDLDTLMADPDWILPDWQLPINKNAPYTPEKIRPLVSYDETEKIPNPCRVEDLSGTAPVPTSTPTPTTSSAVNSDQTLVVFHNNQGPMCLEFLEFAKSNNLLVEQHLTTDPDFSTQLYTYQSRFTQSRGVDQNFGYYPIIFINDQAYSGFNQDVKQALLDQLAR